MIEATATRIENKAMGAPRPVRDAGEHVVIGGRRYVTRRRYIREIEGVPFESDHSDGPWYRMEEARR